MRVGVPFRVVADFNRRRAAWQSGARTTVVSAPLITTLVDASGLFIYFSVAHMMIAQLHA